MRRKQQDTRKSKCDTRKSKAVVGAHRRSKDCDLRLTGSKPDEHEARLRIVRRLIGVLRAAGYACELAPGATLMN
jgi:hypothetical protein